MDKKIESICGDAACMPHACRWLALGDVRTSCNLPKPISSKVTLACQQQRNQGLSAAKKPRLVSSKETKASQQQGSPGSSAAKKLRLVSSKETKACQQQRNQG